MSQDLSTRVTQALTTPKQAAPQHSTAAMSSDEVIALAQVGYEPVSAISSSAVARLGSYAQWSLHRLATTKCQLSLHCSTERGQRQSSIFNIAARSSEVTELSVLGSTSKESSKRVWPRSSPLERPYVESTAPVQQAPTSLRTGLWGKLRHQSSDMAFTSTLSGQDFHLLLRAGGFPVGFVVGTSAFHFGWRTTTNGFDLRADVSNSAR